MSRIVRLLARGRRLVLAVALVSAVLSAALAQAAGLTCAGGAAADPCVVNTQQSFTNAGVQTFDLGGRALVVTSAGRIKVTPGGMSIVARSLDVQGTGSLVATGASGTAGSIVVLTTGDIHVAGTVNASAGTTGGQITLQAGGTLQLDGTINAEGTGASGTGGLVTTVATTGMTISGTGTVLADGGTTGGRVVLVSGQDLRLADGTGPRVDVSGIDAGSIQLWTTGTGAVLIDGILKASADVNGGTAGRVEIDSGGRVTLSPTAIIKAQGGQIGGYVDVDSAGPIQLSTGGGVAGTIDVSGRVQGGTIVLGTAPGAGIALGGLVKAAGSTTDGAGGTITVQSGLDVTLSGAAPVSITGGSGTGLGGELSVAAATGIVVNGPIAATGADGGRIILQAGSALSTTAVLDVGASGSGGFAGLVSLTAQGGDATIGAAIRGVGAGQGAALDITAQGTLTIGAAIDLSGAAPDGSAGAFDLHADGALTQNAAITARARGAGCGLDSEVTAVGTLALGAVDVSGDTCGGSLTVAGFGLVTAAGELDADGTTGFAGALDVSGGNLRISGNLHAAGTDAGGQITLHACDLTLLAGSRVTATGPSARNLLQANATMTIAGAVLGGTNAIQYAGQVPVVQATGSVLPGTTPVHIAGVPCGAPTTTTTSTSSTTSTSTTSSSSTSSSSTSTTSSSTSSSSSTSRTSTTTPTTSTTSSTAPDGSTPTTTVTSTIDTTSTTDESTTTIASTSTSSTSSSSSSSTSSSSSSSTSSTETPPSTTSTTEPPAPACTTDAPEACDDGDPCTDDVCADGVCVNLPPEGTRTVICPLQTVEDAVRTADPDDAGGARVQARLVAKILGVERTVAAAGDAGTPRARGALKRSARQLNAFMRAVERGAGRGTIRADLGYRILAAARQAAANLIPLTRRV